MRIIVIIYLFSGNPDWACPSLLLSLEHFFMVECGKFVIQPGFSFLKVRILVGSMPSHQKIFLAI